jgi:hypothetical protein
VLLPTPPFWLTNAAVVGVFAFVIWRRFERFRLEVEGVSHESLMVFVGAAMTSDR